MYELTVYELCAVRREAMGMNKAEMAIATKYTNYSAFELGKTSSRKKYKDRVFKFLNITSDDIAKCKNGGPAQRFGDVSIEIIKKDVATVLERIKSLKLNGSLGKIMVDEGIKVLIDIEEKLGEIEIIDRLV